MRWPMVCWLVFAAAATTNRADDKIDIVKDRDAFEFVYRVKLPEIKGEARLWIPLARTDAFQTVTGEKVHIPIKWEKVQDRDYGNEICVLRPQPNDTGLLAESLFRGINVDLLTIYGGVAVEQKLARIKSRIAL